MPWITVLDARCASSAGLYWRTVFHGGSDYCVPMPLSLPEVPATARSLRAWLQVAFDPRVMLPLLAALALALIWGLAFAYQRVVHTDAVRTAENSTREMVATYDAHVVRSMEQISRTLDLVAWLHRRGDTMPGLAELAANDLLPPDMMFSVSITDADGRIRDTTRSSPGSLAGRPWFEAHKLGDRGVLVGLEGARPGQAGRVNFTHRLLTPEGKFDGVAVVDVDGAYFVGGYEPDKLGRRGLLALVGARGEIHVMRTGDQVGGAARFEDASRFRGHPESEPLVLRLRTPWDGEERWIGMRELYGFPLAVMVGLSVEEQLAEATRATRHAMGLATAASVVAVAFFALLARQSWLLARSRAREQAIRQAHAERVEYLAYHDGLTGLPNRSLFSKVLAQRIQETRRTGQNLALAYVDLDRFKGINDTLGHEAGDQLLKEVARRLQMSVRHGDTVARLGGDEFVVLMPRVRDENDAAAVARKIVAAMAEPFVLKGKARHVTASVGLSLCPRDGVDEGVLKRSADRAMYEVKAQGRNGFQFYREATMRTDTTLRLRSL